MPEGQIEKRTKNVAGSSICPRRRSIQLSKSVCKQRLRRGDLVYVCVEHYSGQTRLPPFYGWLSHRSEMGIEP